MNFKKWQPKYTGNPGYKSYGRILKITWFNICCFICLITPGTNWLIPFLYRLNKIELFRVTIHNKVV